MMKIFKYLLLFSILSFGFVSSGYSQALTAVIVSQTDESCAGANDGSLVIQVTGGVPATTSPTYTLILFGTSGIPPQGIETPAFSGFFRFDNLASNAGSPYTVLVQDAQTPFANVTTISNIIIDPAPPLIFNGSVSHESCLGTNDGAITINPSGGTTPYQSMIWSSGQTTQNISNVGGGDYTITIVDAKNCNYDSTMTIDQGVEVVADFNFSNECQNDPITFTDASVGSPDSYSWNFGTGATPSTDNTGTPPVVNYSSSGTKSVSLTVTKGVCSDVINKDVTVFELPTATPVITDEVCLGDNSGAIDLNPSGGVSPYTFVWADGPTTEDRTGLTSGNYTVDITDASGCTFNTSMTINPGLDVVADFTFTESCQDSPITFVDASTGSPSGYAWNFGSGATPATVTTSTPADVVYSTSGSKTVQLTVTEGVCSDVVSKTLTIFELPTAAPVVTDEVCFGDNSGAIDLNPSGGTAPYTFVWSDGGTTEDRIGLTSGNYTVDITDAKGCTFNTTVTIDAGVNIVADFTFTNGCQDSPITFVDASTGSPSNYSWDFGTGATPASATTSTPSDVVYSTSGAKIVQLTVTEGTCVNTVSKTVNISALPSASPVVTDEGCVGDNSGAIDLNPNSGTSPYSFVWADGPTTEDRSSLAAGTYTVDITDDNGCTFNTSLTVNPGANAVADFTASNGCLDGAFNFIDASSGTPDSYSWDFGTGATPATDATNAPPAITYGSAGAKTVTLTVTESGCSNTVTKTVDVFALPTATPVVTDEACFGDKSGAIVLNPSGGTTPYSFVWLDGATTEDRTGLTSGNYTVDVTDANGCTFNTSMTINAGINLVADFTFTDDCEDSPITFIDASTGGPTAYAWGFGTGATPATATTSTPAPVTYSSAGTKTVELTITNATCSNTISKTVNVAEAPTASPVVTDEVCFGDNGGVIVLNPSGGTTPYTFVWADGPTTEDRTGLAAGTYTVDITDAKGCTFNTSLTVNPGVEVVADFTFTVGCLDTPVSFTDASTGSPSNYSWDFGTGATPATATTSTPTPVTYSSAGVKTVVLTVTEGTCSDVMSKDIDIFALPTATPVVTDEVCVGDNSGAIVLNPSGGTAPYTFVWADGATTEDRTGLAAGTYTVDITDANGCTFNISMTVNPGANALADFTFTDACLDAPFTFTDATTGTPDSYLWGFGTGATPATDVTNTPPVVNYSSAGIKSVSLTVTEGACSNVITKDITVFELPTAAPVVTDEACLGDNSGAIDLNPGSGVAPYTFVWADGPTTEDRAGLTSGTYTLDITDANGCTFNTSMTVDAGIVLVADFTFTDDCEDSPITFVDGSTGTPTTYAWDFGAGATPSTDATNTPPAVTFSTSGTKTVELTVTEAGCSNTVTKDVNVFEAPSTSPVVSHEVCLGDNSGAIDLNPSGGVAPYTFVWSDGAITEDRTGLAAGTYTVDVTDSQGCTSSTTVIVNPGIDVVADFSFTAGCLNIPVVFTDASTGNPSVYTWDFGATATPSTDATATPPGVVYSTAGVKTVQLTVSEGICSDVVSHDITIFDLPTVTQDPIADVCISDAVFTLVGGLPAGGDYTGDGVTNGDFDPFAAGVGTHVITYTFTDGNGCSDFATTTITVNPGATADFTGTPDICLDNGLLTLTGGTPVGGVYSGLGVTGDDFDPTVAGVGTHILTYTFDDGTGCVGVDKDTLEVFDTPTITLSAIPDMCENEPALDLTQGLPVGGTYSGNGITTSPEFDPSVATQGTHTITYTFVDPITGCTNTPAATDVTVNPLPVVTITASATTICAGEIVDLTATGGGTHSWSPVTTIDDVTSSTPKVNPTVTTTYVDTVTSALGCRVTESITINVNPLPTITASSDATICESDSIQLTVTSDPGASFAWTPSASVVDPTSGVTYVKPTTSTTYKVVVTTVDGCKDSVTIQIDVQPIPTGTFVATVDTVCFGEDAMYTATLDPAFTLSPTGGYSYDNGATFITSNIRSVTGLVAGKQEETLILKDQFGCLSDTLKASVEVLELVTFTLETVNIPTCQNPTQGEFNIKDVKGGVPNYTVSVNTDVRTNVTPTDVEVYDNLPIDIYTIEIEDQFGCKTGTSLSFQNSITFDTVIDHVQCNGQSDGKITIDNVQGGTAPYEFSFEGGAYFGSSVFPNLTAGDYTITIRDAAGCEIPTVLTITEPDALVATVDNLLNESCANLNDGAVTVSVQGGSPRYTFDLNGSVIKDITATFTGLSPGIAFIQVSDSLNCQLTIPFEVLSATPITTYITTNIASDCSASDGFAVLDSTRGGSGNYLYSMDGGVTFKDSLNFIPQLENLAVGVYTINTQDAVGGCSGTMTFSINAVGALLLDSIKQIVTPETCAGGDGSVALSNFLGTTGPFEFQLMTFFGDTILVPYQLDSSFSSLDTNHYYVRIKDGSGCEYKMTDFILDGPQDLVVNIATTPADCGAETGTITAIATGGAAPYSYVLDGGTAQNTGDYIDLAAGTYTLEVTDSSQPDACVVTVQTSVGSTSASAVILTDSTDCSYSSDGTMTILQLFNTDSTLYNYTVSIDESLNFTSDLSYTGLTSGEHRLNIKQTLIADPTIECTYLDNEVYYDIDYEGVFYDTLNINRFLIFAPDTIKAKTVEVPAERGQNDGAIGVYDVSGGHPGYEFGLNPTLTQTYSTTDSTSNFINDLYEGEYKVYIVDSRSCQGEFIEFVTTSFYIPNVFTPNGDGKNDVFEVKGLPENSRLRVYDRWGVRVYFEENYENGWDGGKQPDGTYYYELETENQGTHKGWIQIIR